MFATSHVSSGGQKPPHVVPPCSPVKHGVLALGMHAQSNPPDTHVSPVGHAPLHSGVAEPAHGCEPATHTQLSPKVSQIGASGGHSPQQNGAPLACPHG